MWFLLGALIGALTGCLICIRYLRREIAARHRTQLRHIELQLDNLESAVNLALVTRYQANRPGALRGARARASPIGDPAPPEAVGIALQHVTSGTKQAAISATPRCRCWIAWSRPAQARTSPARSSRSMSYRPRREHCHEPEHQPAE